MKKILPPKEYAILKKLNTPAKIQDFLDTLAKNFEPGGDAVLSPMSVMEKGVCHCVEGAVLAALALRVAGFPPLLLDLTADETDFDHVVAVFQIDGRWGAISKTNHPVLRYREPIYKTIRELAMSFFHDYVNVGTGKKTLRSFSRPVNLKRFDHLDWMTTKGEVDYIAEYMDTVKHYKILTGKQIRNLRSADPIEVQAGAMQEWQDPAGRPPHYLFNKKQK
ncbi:MAG: hypothetical protein WC238_05250 [Parcubacteria group bacterium]|jgi:hypothetical protein